MIGQLWDQKYRLYDNLPKKSKNIRPSPGRNRHQNLCSIMYVLDLFCSIFLSFLLCREPCRRERQIKNMEEFWNAAEKVPRMFVVLFRINLAVKAGGAGKKFDFTIYCPFKTHINTCRADRPWDCTLDNSSFSSFWCTGTEGKQAKSCHNRFALRKFAALKVCGHCRMTNNDKGERGVGKKALIRAVARPFYHIRFCA